MMRELASRRGSRNCDDPRSPTTLERPPATWGSPLKRLRSRRYAMRPGVHPRTRHDGRSTPQCAATRRQCGSPDRFHLCSWRLGTVAPWVIVTTACRVWFLKTHSALPPPAPKSCSGDEMHHLSRRNDPDPSRTAQVLMYDQPRSANCRCLVGPDAHQARAAVPRRGVDTIAFG